MSETQTNEIVCPLCSGRGGFFDYFGEYSECAECNERGFVTIQEHDEYISKIEGIDKFCQEEAKRNGWV